MQPGWMTEAWREYGQTEISGSASNARILALFRDAGHPSVKNDDVAWCAAYVSACLERAGYRSTRSLLARSYLGWGDAARQARQGTIAVFTRGNDPGSGHVGFWISENASNILLLGGNQANSVNLTWIAKSRLIGLRMPGARGAVEPEPFFRTALAHVLNMEGGYTDDPHDPGGPTNLGITLATLAAYKDTSVSSENIADLKREIKTLTRETAEKIYQSRYWQPSAAADLPQPVGLMHFDSAVNQGVGTAARMLQEAAGADIDGIIGPLTRRAVWGADPVQLVNTYADIRSQRYRALRHFWRFGRGWLNRVENTRRNSLELAKSAKPATAPQPTAFPLPRTNPGDPDMSQTANPNSASQEKWWGESLTIWGTIVTGLSTVLPVIAPLIGLNLTSDLVVLLGEQIVQVAQAVGGLVGTLMIIQGRMRATTRLVSRKMTVRL